jgi:hypothetical protein
MDECQGSSVYDSSGNGLTGTINLSTTGSQTTALGVGTCTTNASTPRYNGRTGKYNSSLNFDGTSDFVTISDNSLLDYNTFSLSAWIKPSTVAPTRQGIISKRTTSGAGAYFIGLVGGAFEGYANNGSDNAFSAGTVTAGQWAHVVFIYDGSSMKIYQNGVLVGSQTLSGAIINSTHSLDIGHEYVGTNLFFSGQIDEVQLFNYPLTDAQVKLLNNQNSAVRFGPATGTP